MSTPRRKIEESVLELILRNQLTLLSAASCMQNIPDSLDRNVREAMDKTKAALDQGIRLSPSPSRHTRNKERKKTRALTRAAEAAAAELEAKSHG